jgi:hypothetical protein
MLTLIKSTNFRREEMATTQMTGDNKKKALDLALSGIEKQFGKGAIMKLGTEKPNKFLQSLQVV